MQQLINKIPKAELHLHIEGSLEPELMFKLAQKNQIQLPFDSVSAVKKAYNFSNLQSFLDIYYTSAAVLVTEQDFYDLTWAYLSKMARQKVLHTEIFFDPQTHTSRGVFFATVINGITGALEQGKKNLGISSKLIMCFLRHLSADEAMVTLEEALAYQEAIIGVGLDSSEMGHPPVKFKEVFAKAKAEGFLTVAHAGEEGPAAYIWEAIKLLKVSRIDHGVRCLEEPKLVEYLAEKQIPLTVCPLSNVKLKVFNSLSEHNLKELLKLGLRVTINSDDPAYFGGYVNENFQESVTALNLSQADVYQLAKNSFTASFLSEREKEFFIKKLDDVISNFPSE